GLHTIITVWAVPTLPDRRNETSGGGYRSRSRVVSRAYIQSLRCGLYHSRCSVKRLVKATVSRLACGE
ncbi:hypothetical protein J6590_101541, partial [Homalodisca vitripennis]